MRVGINLLFLLPEVVGGMETYAAGLIRGLAELRTGDTYFVFVNRKARDWPLPELPCLRRVVCAVSGQVRALRYFYEQTIFCQVLRDYDLDLVHSLGYVAPLFTPCASIVTIPDLNYVVLKRTIPIGKRIMLRLFSGLAVHRSSLIITISESSKRQIAQYWGIDPAKIRVTHLGAGWVEGQGDLTDEAGGGGSWALPRPYMAAFGGGSDHKNIDRLVQAFAEAGTRLPHDLVLIGRISAKTRRAIAGLDSFTANRIHCVGYVPSSQIRQVLAAADFFVLPSLYEGFGLPLLEAQLAGAPVTCSHAGSLPEVAGGSALLFDPTSIDDMGSALVALGQSQTLRESLRSKGRANVARFSWVETASKTHRVYCEAASSRS